MPALDKSRPLPAQDPWPAARLRKETQPLDFDFFAASATALARELLGTVLVHGDTAGMIVETEAYLGADDLAAHSSRGVTPRTSVIFGPPGRAYVYFIYGMHECLNVVADRDGVPGCVLIRALEPLSGLQEMHRRRNWQRSVCGLTNGPGKLTEALAITREHYGRRLDTGDPAIRQWREPPRFTVAAGPRIGITQCIDWPLRFTWDGHPCLSRLA